MDNEELMQRLAALESDREEAKRASRKQDFIKTHGSKFKNHEGVADDFLARMDERGVDATDEVLEELLEEYRTQLEEARSLIDELRDAVTDIKGAGPEGGEELPPPPEMPPPPDMSAMPPTGPAAGAPPPEMPPPPPDMGAMPPAGPPPPQNPISDEKMKDVAGPAAAGLKAASESSDPAEGLGAGAGAAIGTAVGGPAGGIIGGMLGGAVGETVGHQGEIVSDERVKGFAEMLGFEFEDYQDLRNYLEMLEGSDPDELNLGDRMLYEKWIEAGEPEDQFGSGTIEIDPENFDPKTIAPEDAAELNELLADIDAGEVDEEIASQPWVQAWRDHQASVDMGETGEVQEVLSNDDGTVSEPEPEFEEPPAVKRGLLAKAQDKVSDVDMKDPAAKKAVKEKEEYIDKPVSDIDENEIIATALARRY